MPAEKEIRVHVIDYGRDTLMLRYRDPVTRKQVTKDSGTAIRKEALKAAGAWQSELREKGHQPVNRISWENFRERYEDEYLTGLKGTTVNRVAVTFGHVEKFIAPQKLSQLTTSEFSRLQSKMRADGMAETTIASEMKQIRAALQWAVDLSLLSVVPKIPRVKRGKQQRAMKGRPLTDKEFPKMLKHIEGNVEAGDEPAWQWYLEGLYWGGLRLEESIDFWWDRPDKLCVVEKHGYLMISVPPSEEKGNTRRTLPIAPEFEVMLRKVLKRDRTGLVFKLPRNRRCDHETPSKDWVSHTVSAIGKAAGIVVDVAADKYATAHDLRRAFGTRWAKRVTPQVLMILMRHDSIETTMRFYVDLEAADVAAMCYDALAREKSGNTLGNRQRTLDKKKTQQHTAKRLKTPHS